MKRRRWRVSSLARRVATGIGFGDGGIGRVVGDEEGSGWAELGHAAWQLGPVLMKTKRK
jgi:hypothetical protein